MHSSCRWYKMSNSNWKDRVWLVRIWAVQIRLTYCIDLWKLQFILNSTNPMNLSTLLQDAIPICQTTGNKQDRLVGLMDPSAWWTDLFCNLLAARSLTINFLFVGKRILSEPVWIYAGMNFIPKWRTIYTKIEKKKRKVTPFNAALVLKTVSYSPVLNCSIYIYIPI